MKFNSHDYVECQVENNNNNEEIVIINQSGKQPAMYYIALPY